MKPCPFCGSTNIDPEGWCTRDGVTGPACNNCSSSAGSYSKTSQDNAALWDTRPLEQELEAFIQAHTINAEVLKAELLRMTEMRDDMVKEARMAEAKITEVQQAVHGDDK
jgi:hypothetical protein